MKVLVTGAAGFIGSHLSKKLLALGHEVIGLDNINSYYPVSLKEDRLTTLGIEVENVMYKRMLTSSVHDNFRFVKIDILDNEALGDLFRSEQFEVVINLAAQVGVRYSVENPSAYLRSNVEGFFNIVEKSAVHKVGHLVYASSSSVYGANDKIPFSTKDNVDHPISFYAATKKSNELFAHTYSHLYNLPTSGLRFFTVYGPWGRPDMAPFIFAKKILKGEPITVFNHGDLRRDFTFVDDIVQGIVTIMDNPPKRNDEIVVDSPDTGKAPYRVYNLGNNSPEEIKYFIELIEEFTGKKADIKYDDLQPGDLVETFSDMEVMKNEYDFMPQVSLREGMQRFVEWYMEYYGFKEKLIHN